jgi:hypothetical protein
MNDPHSEHCSAGRFSEGQHALLASGKKGIAMLRPKGKRPGVSKLPKPGTTRWTALRKAAVVSAVEAGQLSMHEACERYSLTIEEFLSWQVRLAQHGAVALQTSKVKRHRLRLRRPT